MHPDPVWWHWLALLGITALSELPVVLCYFFKPEWLDLPSRAEHAAIRADEAHTREIERFWLGE